MTTSVLTLPILGASSWFEADPGFPEPPGLPDRVVGKPSLDFLEPIQRRRLSSLARGVFHCTGRIGPPGDVPLVFASRHGEAERTLAILGDLAAGAEVSPLLFSMSVHNAVPGLLSILRGNRAPATALAAGSESFGYGLLAACAQWREAPETPVLFLFGEERLPELWRPFAPEEVPHAVALLIGEGGRPLRMTWSPAGRGAESGRTQSLHFLAGATQPWTGPTASWDWRLA